MNWSWLADNLDIVLEQMRVHVQITVAALALSVVVALPLGVAAYRWPSVYPWLRVVIGALYTIPGLALFAVLVTVVGLGAAPVVIALALYALVILVANLVEGLRAVPRDIVDAAAAVGYRPATRLFAVELPLAVPTLIAGLRAAAASTISLVSLGALVGSGGLGQLLIHGFQVANPVEIWTGLAGTVVLAVIADLSLVLAGRTFTPWLKARS
ncbi:MULTISPECIES: ABC transporter permease [unclassified Kribbella]|uniref:ABC transporter permease n=1 Tax=unclassified Kribbella TaxID=2644121 RepID=UPI003409E07E